MTRGGRDGTAPAAFTDHVLVHGGDDLRLLAADTGTQRWRTGGGGTTSGISAFAGDTDRLVANRYGRDENSTVVAYDPATGEETWRVETGGRVGTNLTPTPGGLLFTRRTDSRAFLVPTA